MRNRPVRLLILLFTLLSLGGAQPRGEEQEISDTILKQLVDLVGMHLKDMDPQRPWFVPRHAEHFHDSDPCYPMAYLYKTKHRLNPYYGRIEVRDTALAIADEIVATKGRPEWPLYLVAQVYGLLKDEMPEPKRQAWKAYVQDYVETRGVRPFFYTSPNHEAWNALGILHAGQVFQEPSWIDRGSRLMHQLVKLQTALGYFDEGKHHGPTMKYNQVQIAPMLLFADYARDPEVLAASKKLADFMIRYSFPDGSPIGAFDGRQSYSLGFFGSLCYGLDRWPLGKELNRRIFRTRKKWNILSVSSPNYNFSEWYASFGGFFVLDEYLSLRPNAPTAPLPQDRNGYRAYDEGPSFAGGVIRQHDWMVALSAIDSDVPKYAGGIFQLERQSRLDVWHPRTGLIIGGGSGPVEAETPLANFLLLTGHNGVDGEFGRLAGGNKGDRQAVYFPRHLKATLGLDEQTLEANFGQGDFSFIVKPLSATQLELNYRYDLIFARKAFVQVPLILFRDSKVQVDGSDYQGGPMKVRKEIRIHNPTMGSTVRISVPAGKEILMNAPVDPLRAYDPLSEDERYKPYYQIALLSLKIDPPQGSGGGRFLLEIEDQ